MKHARIRNLIAATVVALGSSTVFSPASAAVVCDPAVGMPTVADVCHGVVFNGIVYDVRWREPNYPSDPNPPFAYADLPDAPLAMIAAINTGLNKDGFQSIQYQTSSTPATAPYYYLPYYIYSGTGNVETLQGVFDNYPSSDVIYGSEDLTNGAGIWYTNTTNTDLDSVTRNPYAFSWSDATQNTKATAYLTQTGTVPVPAALPLLLSGIGFMGWLARRRRAGC